MRGAEGIVHERVAELRQLPREGRVIALFLRVKADVFEQQHAAWLEHAYRCFGGRTDAVRGEWAGGSEQLAEALRDGLQRILRVRLAVGPAEVGEHDDAGAVLTQVRERRERGADAGIVGHLAVFHGHVEVDTDERGFAGPIGVADGAEAAHARCARGVRCRLAEPRGQPDTRNPTPETSLLAADR